MTDFACKHDTVFGNMGCRVLLCAIWILGIASGICLHFIFEPVSVSLMRSAIQLPVSIVGLCTCIFLPLIFTCIAVYLNRPIIILVVCFIKSAAFGFSCALIREVFGDADWLIRSLVLFSDICFSLVLLAHWLCFFGAKQDICLWRTRICVLFGILIAAFDYFMISPFIMGL